MSTGKGTEVNKLHYQCYYNDMVLIEKNRWVTAECAEITFYNRGTATVTINNIPFEQNQGISFDGMEGELDVTKYQVIFAKTGTRALFVVRKCYTQPI